MSGASTIKSKQIQTEVANSKKNSFYYNAAMGSVQTQTRSMSLQITCNIYVLYIAKLKWVVGGLIHYGEQSHFLCFLLLFFCFDHAAFSSVIVINFESRQKLQMKTE